ncbi:MAG TPA: hypothetical protein VGY57_09525 [Vicinamibacterales bacterium]|jgi:hypothetical protein|nr:hypothetical protein [Vicinamibacterales bacterium]
MQAGVSSRWSSDVQALINPASAIAAWRHARDDGMWTLVRRPLLWLLVGGCFVSIEASGRFSLRLIVDGVVSFAFVPIAGVVSLACVRQRDTRISFARAVDLFFTSNAPWFLWILAVAALRAIESPLQAVSTPVWAFWTLMALLAGAAAWAAYIDLQFFRAALAPRRPVRALIAQRVIGWTAAVGYFLGIAIWPSIVGFVRG